MSAYFQIDGPVFGLFARPDLPAEEMGHQLGAIADPEDRLAEFEDLFIDGGGAFEVDGIRAAGEDDPFDLGVFEAGEVMVKRDDFRIDLALTDAPGDQLVVLAAEIQNDDFVHWVIIASFLPLA